MLAKKLNYLDNIILDFHQKKMYAEFNGDGVRPSEVPNAEDIWGDIWSVGKEHN